MTTRLTLPAVFAAALFLGACSASDGESVATAPDSTNQAVEPRASLTMEDGTTFAMGIDLCDVAANTEKSEGYLFFLGSQLEGADELFFRAALSPRPDGGIATLDGILQTDYVDGDPKANYEFGVEGSTFTIEGTTVSGEIAFHFKETRGENDIFGPSTTGVFTADCSPKLPDQKRR